MHVSFILTLDVESVDPNAIQNTSENLTDLIDNDYDVVEVKPFPRGTMPAATTTPTGAPPVSGAL